MGFVLALVVILAFVLVALNASAANNSPQETVVVAKTDLTPRIPITKDDLTTRLISVPASYPKVYFTSAAEVAGMIPLVTIHADQAITANDVVKANAALGGQSEFLPIPPGYVALTIPTSEQQGVADSIQPGDYIAMIATVSTAGKVATMTIFTQLHVIKVGTQTAGTGAIPTSLTVVVTQCQAEMITWFLTYASLKYSLESFHDYSPGDQSPDPKCPSVGAAHGVTLPTIKVAFPGLF